MTRYANEQGFPNIQYFVDDGYSGANFNRPDWQRMIELVEADKVGILLAKDMSRIGRNYLEVGFYTVGFYTEVLFPRPQRPIHCAKQWRRQCQPAGK